MKQVVQFVKLYTYHDSVRHYIRDFECDGDEVLVESTPPASPAHMAARLAQAQSGGAVTPPTASVRELIVIPELPNTTLQLQHAIQQVEVNGDSSGESSPSTDPQHTYITVAMNGGWGCGDPMTVKTEIKLEDESEGNTGVNYHVQYVEQQDIYTTTQEQPHIETLRTYPVYNVTPAQPAHTQETWEAAVYAPADESPPPAPRMPPATVTWLLDHYETADGVSLPRSTLYSHYLRHCSAHRLEPVNAASFGKLIRSVFVGLRTRRLGTRGNSKYHYYGIRAKPSAERELTPPRDEKDEQQEERSSDSVEPASCAGAAHRQYLGCVRAPSPPPPPRGEDTLHVLRRHHREHGAEFLEAVASLDTSAVERCRRNFWRRPPPDLPRKELLKLTARQDVADWLNKAELQLHQKAVELLLPDVLKPIPPHLTQSIRNFAKSLEGALAAGSAGAPAAAAAALRSAAAALSAALRRYTSLNHLAQAARAVLANKHQIHQMLADLNRVDFRVVREQAAWACSCGGAAAARKLEADFKAELGRGASLEQWATWLEGCVLRALSPHEARPGYSARARRLLLDWSFYSSLVIRELTLRSAASFGSFHLIRLLYDEYVSYVIERRVAAHERSPPIAVMHRALAGIQDELDAEETEATEENPEDQSQEDQGVHEDDEDDPTWEWADDDEEEEIEAKRCKTD